MGVRRMVVRRQRRMETTEDVGPSGAKRRLSPTDLPEDNVQSEGRSGPPCTDVLGDPPARLKSLIFTEIDRAIVAQNNSKHDEIG